MHIGGGAKWAAMAASTLALACSRSVEPGQEGTPVDVPFAVPDIAGDGKHQVVAIIDTGFDLSLPVYSGKIVGGYTITCAPPPSAKPPAESFSPRCAYTRV